MTEILSLQDWKTAGRRAIERLAAGRCVGLPTETVYGLAGDATNGDAVAEIFAMKGRPKFNPLICHVCDLAMAEAIGAFDDAARALANALWPGPLTVVVPVRTEGGVHDLATAGLDTVAIRCPQGPARQLITQFGRPLAAPSANRSGKISPTTAEHVAGEFADTDLLILDDGPCRAGIESTIVKIVDGGCELLRSGAVTVEEIEATGAVAVRRERTSGRIEAPGMLDRHYAPATPLRLEAAAAEPGCGLLAFGPADGRDRSAAVVSCNLSEAGDTREAATNLYGMLRELDGAGCASICVEPIPADGLGAAINDRLARAATPAQAA